MTLQSLFKTRSGQARSEELPQASPEALQPTVLIVDDEPGILGALKRVLHHEPYRVLTTTNPMEAFHLLATHSVQMVISDQRMPEMTGTELLLQVKLLYPDVVRVILTGYTDEEAIMAAINDGQVYKFLFKPWNAEALKLELYHALKYHSALAASRENQACQQVVDQMPAPLLVVDAADRLLRFNRAAAHLFPALQTTLPGQDSHDALPVDVSNALMAARQSGQPLWCAMIRHNDLRYRMSGTQLAPGPAGNHWILLFQPLDLPSGHGLQVDADGAPLLAARG
jgi:CheY-like chemotaxis protein